MDRTWIGGNVDWVDSGSTANWTPADEPDSDDTAIFNTPNAVNLGSNNVVNGLTLSGGIDLNTNDFDLTVDGLVTVGGASTNLFIGSAAGSVNTDNVTINASGIVELRGGLLTMDEEVGAALIDLNAGGVLQGNGSISFADNPGVATALLVNDGTLTALSRGVTVFSPPPVGMLSISGLGANARLDLDGSGEAGVVNINRNQKIGTDMPLFDTFNGTLNLFHNSELQMGAAFTLGTGGSIVVDNGFVAGGLGFSDIPADVATVDVALLTQSGGTINVTDTDGTLNIDSPFTMSGGSFTNSGTVIFNGVTNITTAAGYDPSDINSQTIVNANVTITDAAGNFNWDGNGQSDTIINGSAVMSITANQIDTSDNVFGGTISLNDDADLGVSVAAAVWTLGGTLNKNNLGGSGVSGSRVIVTGAVNANAGTLQLPSTTTTATANIVTNGTLILGSATEFGGGTIGGTGTLQMQSTSTVTANTTIGTATFDWDGVGSGTTHSINSGVTFTINSPTFDSDGDMDDPINLAGSGSILDVNNSGSWTMNRTLTTNVAALGIASLNGNSRMILNGALGVWNATGQTAVNAPVTFGASSTANIAAAGFIRLNGGDNVSVFNRIEGGTINGPGSLNAINNRELRGFGTINAPISFSNTSKLKADDGTLTIGGAIIQVDTIGTADADAVLSVTNAWNTNVATNVNLSGGTLQGGAITVGNANGITGHGLVSARVINNAKLSANDAAQTLVFETAANDNDWDGGANTGQLAASNGATLEVRDNATFTYGGTVTAIGGSKVYAKGFGFNFGSTSAINLTGSTLQTDETTSISGPITVGAGPDSTINVQVNRFLTIKSTSAVSLSSNLNLVSNNASIEAGATFSGAGAVVVPTGSHLILEPNANVNVLLANNGTLRPSGFNTVGAETVKDYQQGDTGTIEFEFNGNLLNQFDRLLVGGNAVLDGRLILDIDGGFVPVLNQTFDIISATFGRSGTFDTVDSSGMPAGLAFRVNYLPNLVQLQVVNKPTYAADFDDDGDVDMTDYAIWKAAFNLNQLGDANGDNISDASDWTIWRDTLGSVPGAAVVNGAAVPEPAALLVLLALLPLIPGMRRSRC